MGAGGGTTFCDEGARVLISFSWSVKVVDGIRIHFLRKFLSLEKTTGCGVKWPLGPLFSCLMIGL